MRRIFTCLLVIFTTVEVRAQDKTVTDLKEQAAREVKKDATDTIPKTWKKGALLNLAMSQTALSNWAAGGDKNAFAINTFFSGYAFYKKGKHSWDNTLDLAYGMVKTTSLGMRKSDDRIDLLSKYGYEVAKSWYISGLVNVRSQFAPGYSYADDKSQTLTSGFFSPGYVLVSPGVNYKPNDNFSIFVSPATARFTFVRNDSLAAMGAYGVDSGKNSRTEFGAFATVSYQHKLGTAAIYTGRLDLFSNYSKNPQNVDIYFTNLLAVKITSIFSMTFAFNLIYDDDVKSVKADGTQGAARAQIQEILGIGIALKLL